MIHADYLTYFPGKIIIKFCFVFLLRAQTSDLSMMWFYGTAITINQHIHKIQKAFLDIIGIE